MKKLLLAGFAVLSLAACQPGTHVGGHIEGDGFSIEGDAGKTCCGEHHGPDHHCPPGQRKKGKCH